MPRKRLPELPRLAPLVVRPSQSAMIVRVGDVELEIRDPQQVPAGWLVDVVLELSAELR